MFINEDYQLLCQDGVNITLHKREIRKADGVERWRHMGHYFGDFHTALRFLAMNEIKGTGIEDVKAVCAKVDELYAMIDSLRTPKDLLQAKTRRPAKLG
jgi:hypothetical protein